MASRLQLSGISKAYGTLRANDGIDLAVSAGEIHAVLGENGAGKSTLMKIIYGVTKPDAGHMQFDGQTVHIRDPRHARSLGIAMVFQHFSLFETLTVAENVWLGLDKSFTLDAVRGRIRAVTQQYGLELDPQRHVHSLSVGERQRVEIVRALLTNPKLLILDEPTSVLTPQAVQKLFGTLRQLASEGCSILYISHKLDEIRALCHSCTVLRGGKVTGRVDPRHETIASLSRLMIGAEPPTVQHAVRAAGSTRLAVKDLNLPRLDQFGTALRDISFEVHSGEILGIAGVSGNGQAELLAALSGEDARAASDAITLDDFPAGDANPQVRRERGLNFVPEERLGRGAVPSLSLAENLLLTDNRAGRISHGWIKRKAVTEQAGSIIKTFDVKTGGPQAAARSLSGGNLQKFIVGREIMQSPKVLIVSQPTWGVDVGAAARIHEELARLRDAGCAILVVSEELDELFELCDRLVVMAKGSVSPAIKTSDATVEQIGQWMSGLWKPEAMEAGHAAA